MCKLSADFSYDILTGFVFLYYMIHINRGLDLIPIMAS